MSQPTTSDQKLAAIASIIVGVQPGPGMPPFAPPTTPALPWHRNPGAAYVPGETAADNPQRAKELAAQGIRVNGDPGSVQGADRDYALLVCDFVALASAENADALVEGAVSCDVDSRVYQIALGQFNGELKGGAGGRARLMFPNTTFADVIHKPGQPVGGNVAG